MRPATMYTTSLRNGSCLNQSGMVLTDHGFMHAVFAEQSCSRDIRSMAVRQHAHECTKFWILWYAFVSACPTVFACMDMHTCTLCLDQTDLKLVSVGIEHCRLPSGSHCDVSINGQVFEANFHTCQVNVSPAHVQRGCGLQAGAYMY